ncbi:hypothetical protein B4U80_13493 [Leptotrombidium deliense]|uniref:Terpene synthase n=1 Tax=Leptotrombidium deliense TaxID=299467 RepID=A0A443S5G2_9ACAR|nr:hypothetical protein B4U80_13493 [Leptotrombidium deliense]
MEMRMYNYPKMNMYFPSRLHIDYEKILEESSQWIIEFKLHSDNTMYKRENLTKLTCMCYPDGDYERTLLVNKWMIHVFALDDITEGKVVKCPFFGSLAYHGSENKDVISLLDKCFEYDETPLVRSFADIWKQLKSITNKTWQQRFAENYVWYFKANDWEQKNIEMNRVPTLAEYMNYRHYISGVDAFFNLIEIASNIFIPDSAMANVTLQRFVYLAGNVVAAANDIYSYEKEKRDGQINNLVHVMKHEYNICDQEAIEKATDFVNDEMKKLLVVERILPIFEEKVNDCVQKYVDGCKSWISGSHDWGLESGRYKI